LASGERLFPLLDEWAMKIANVPAAITPITAAAKRLSRAIRLERRSRQSAQSQLSTRVCVAVPEV
jgi:hypothetical protein